MKCGVILVLALVVATSSLLVQHAQASRPNNSWSWRDHHHEDGHDDDVDSNRLEDWVRRFQREGGASTPRVLSRRSRSGHLDPHGPQIKVNQTFVVDNGDWVRVFFNLNQSDAEERREEDGVGAASASAAAADGNGVAWEEYHYICLFQGLEFLKEKEWPAVPLKWKVLTEEDKRRGYVDARMLLVGQEDEHFALIHHDYHRNEVVVEAISEGVSFQNPDEPVGVHLAVGYEPEDLVVQWNTFGSITRDKPYDPVVLVIDDETKDGIEFSGGRTETYGREDLCGSPANSVGYVEPGYTHTLTMKAGEGLVAGRRYTYFVGDKDRAMRGPFSLIAPVGDWTEAGDDDYVSIFAIADMGEFPIDGFQDQGEEISTQPSVLVVRGMREELERSDSEGSGQWLMVHNGDIAYARGYGAIWHSFFDRIEPLASRMPYMTTIGNHERDWPHSGDRYGGKDSNGECGVPYMARTPMPRPSGPDKPWYSFKFGPVHFVQLSTEHEFGRDSEQFSFVMDELDHKVNRTATPWLIFGFHRPLYIDSTYDDPKVNSSDQVVARELRDAFERVFLEYEVDMTWVGHHHSYQRTCGVFESKCVPKDASDGTERAPVHVVLGHAGANLCDNLYKKKPDYFEVVENTKHGFTKVEASRTSLRMRSFDTEGGLIDDFTLKARKHHH
ncbi:metallophosphatase [Chloropicon primus]|uniref:Purple acid phosphatase n=2 Tax=Chloropicon primus TaxID=1764295 RepID=A0A5B8MZ72_9CHLO|nr:metallophosphatase [Chloropicon primus]UPR05148.1 metallophosphatase [Chloropicon primus]|eukprot:QDZ25947.1 metallophosphatase [Chloropicon primus]